MIYEQQRVQRCQAKAFDAFKQFLGKLASECIFCHMESTGTGTQPQGHTIMHCPYGGSTQFHECNLWKAKGQLRMPSRGYC